VVEAARVQQLERWANVMLLAAANGIGQSVTDQLPDWPFIVALGLMVDAM